jgi:acyl-CoA thioester hydrolase
MYEMITRRRIEFSDTDLGGVVHFSRYFIFMESAEDQFLRALGTGFTFQHEGREGGWPKVAASCEYASPARYGDEVDVHLSVSKVTRSTVSYQIVFRRDGTVLARGRTTSVCCARKPAGGYESIAIPASLAARLEVAPEPRD